MAPAPARPSSADRFATIALLAYGLVNVVVTGLSYLDIVPVMNQTMSMLGIDGEFTNYAAGRLWGTIATAAFCLVVPMMGDPAFIAYLDQATGAR